MRTGAAGYTLLEVTVVLGIVSILLLAIFALGDLGWSSFETAEAQTIVNEELRKALDAITDDLREGGAHTIAGVPADNTWYPTLSFNKPTGVVNGRTVWSPNVTQYTVGGQSGMDFIRTVGNVPRVLARNILLFRARRAPARPDVVELRLRAQRANLAAPDVESELFAKVTLRN